MEARTCSECAESGRRFAPGMMARIPPSGTAPFTFTRGSDDTVNYWNSYPAHQVTLTSGFYMGKYQVTQEQWEAVMGNNPSSFRAGGGGAGQVTGLDTSRFPVERVSWYDVIVFANRLSKQAGLTPVYEIGCASNGEWTTYTSRWGSVPTSGDARWNNVRMVEGSTGYRLPTEAQWEFACRAGTITPWNTGTSITTSEANFDGVLGRTTEVGDFEPNAWGLYDMHGNVWEWVWDWFGAYSSEAQTDPVGVSSGSFRVFRGGGWHHDAQAARSTVRGHYWPNRRWFIGGFRLVRPQ